MNNEIKEILDDLKQCCKNRDRFDIHENTADILLDYITNLQEENERLNKQYDLMEQSLDDKQKVIDKAIKYVEWNLDANAEIIDYFNCDMNFNKLLNILKGENK